MKKIILGFVLVFVMNFGLKALAEQTGCQAYCDSVKTCCDEKKIGQISQIAENCDTQRKTCLETYENTLPENCPEPESCD